MNDLEVSKRLALKIGWKPKQLKVKQANGKSFLEIEGHNFDYRDRAVFVPIMNVYVDMFPWQSNSGLWHYKYVANGKVHVRSASSFAKAVAMSVIGES
jgi:hypothetical protein